MPRNCCKYFTVSLVPVAALTLAILFIGAIITLPVLYEELATRSKYGVVIDAGSSHTDVYVYSWSIPRDTSKFTTGRLKQKYKCTSYASLNDYVQHPGRASNAFSTCLDDSYHEEIPPTSARKHTEIYLGATAGMRLLNMSNASASEAIFKAVRQSLSETKFQFQNEQAQARIIEENVEAASGWVTANYAAKNFDHQNVNTVGSLDLGGASVEIAFLPPKQYDLSSSNYSASVNLFGKHYSVYARSYLCYGHNEAQKRYWAHLVDQTFNSSVIQDPCLQRGSNTTVTSSDVFDICVTNSTTAVEAFGYEINPPPWLSTADTNITFNGTGDAELCNKTMKTVFNFSTCNVSDTCINGQYFWPPVDHTSKEFKAFSGFHYVASYYDVSTLVPAGLDAFWSKVHKVCNSSYSHTEGSGDKFQCFNGAFMLHLLEAGFGFNNTAQNWTITFTDKLNGITVGWAMGYLMTLTDTIPPKPYYTHRPYTAVDLVVGIIVLSILCIVFIVFFALTCNACRKVVKNRRGYTDIVA